MMKVINRVIFFSFLFVFFLYGISFCSMTCFAQQGYASYYGGQGIRTGGASYGIGTNSFKGYLGYRITLIDNNGNKYPGTHSVDVTYAPTNQDTAVVVSRGTQYNLFYQNYKYRFGENDASSYFRIGTRILPFENNIFDPASHLSFVSTYIEGYDDTAVFCPSSWDASNVSCDPNDKIDFISLFLYYSGYFKNKSPKKFENVLIEDHSLINYYLSMELLVEGDYSYGTSTEMLQYMYQFGNSVNAAQQYRDNMAVEKLNFACGLFTTQSFKEKYPNFTKFDSYFSDYDDCVRKSLVGEGKNILWTGNGCVTNNTQYAYGVPGLFCGVQNWGGGSHIDNLKNFNETMDKYASGVAMVSLNFPSGIVTEKSNSILNLCDNNSVSYTIKILDGQISNNALFKTNSNVDDVQAQYCYDNVTYNYSALVDSISGDKLYNTIIDKSNIPPIVAKIKRKCSSYNGISVIDDIKKDYNKSIKVNAYGKDNEFKPDLDNITLKDGFYYINYYVSESILIKGNLEYNSVQTGYIDFSNYKQMFGKSNNFIDYILKQDNSKCDPSILGNSRSTNCFNEGNMYYGLTFSDKSSDGKCNFNYKIKKDDDNISTDSKFVFRVISLDNPFPARDGSSRLPGLNWLNDDENNVFQYIVNNRGIRYITGSNDTSPEEMYKDVEPMYTVTLTPSTMIRIRNYNKKFPYDSMYESKSTGKTSNDAYKLVCNYHDLGSGKVGNGRECYSEFLREYISSSVISGLCYLSSSDINKNDTIYPSSDSIFNSLNRSGSAYSKVRDLNKNNRVDYEDWYISLPTNQQKNINFYTCANKTFLSGGPIEGGW